jgi:Zn-dependent peptidase ImmA (M78 family)
MTQRDELLDAGRKAAEVLDDVGARKRIDAGHTRIDPFAIAADEGVPVIVRPLERLLGAFLREDQPGILVNGQRPVGLIHMTCAHELGHYFLGHHTMTDERIDYGDTANLQERQADWFAYMLLTPRWLFAKLMRMKDLTTTSLRDATVLYQLSLRMGVSYTGTVWSARRQNLINADQAEALARVKPRDIKSALAGIELSASGSQDVWLLDGQDRDLVLEPRIDDMFVVDLPSHASAGYLWTLDEATREGFQLQPMLVNGEHEPTLDGGARIGGASSLRYRLEPSQANRAEAVHFSFQESQPWSPSKLATGSFRLSAQFEAINLGLTRQARQCLVDEVRSK